MRKSERGIAHIAVILAVVVIAVAGFAGFKVYLSNSNNKENSSASDNTSKDGAQQNGLEKSVSQVSNAADSCSPPAPAEEAKNAFRELPFKTEELKLVTLGKETNDPRFVYPWVKNERTNIYAPADGKLYMIRHKVYEIDGKKGNDYDMFFAVDCKTVYRFNHISNPRDDIKAAYPAGDLPSGDYANGGTDMPERVKPKSAISVKAGESLGYTVGTPTAKNFDFAVGVSQSKEGDKLAVCPFSVFNEPLKTQLLNMLGPKSGSPTPGYPCEIEAKKF